MFNLIRNHKLWLLFTKNIPTFGKTTLAIIYANYANQLMIQKCIG